MSSKTSDAPSNGEACGHSHSSSSSTRTQESRFQRFPIASIRERCDGRTPPMKYLKRLLPFLWPHRNLIAAAAVVSLFGVLASLLTPWPLKILIDNVLGGIPPSRTLAWVLGSAA